MSPSEGCIRTGSTKSAASQYPGHLPPSHLVKPLMFYRNLHVDHVSGASLRCPCTAQCVFYSNFSWVNSDASRLTGKIGWEGFIEGKGVCVCVCVCVCSPCFACCSSSHCIMIVYWVRQVLVSGVVYVCRVYSTTVDSNMHQVWQPGSRPLFLSPYLQRT